MHQLASAASFILLNFNFERGTSLNLLLGALMLLLGALQLILMELPRCDLLWLSWGVLKHRILIKDLCFLRVVSLQILHFCGASSIHIAYWMVCCYRETDRTLVTDLDLVRTELFRHNPGCLTWPTDLRCLQGVLVERARHAQIRASFTRQLYSSLMMVRGRWHRHVGHGMVRKDLHISRDIRIVLINQVTCATTGPRPLRIASIVVSVALWLIVLIIMVLGWCAAGRLIVASLIGHCASFFWWKEALGGLVLAWEAYARPRLLMQHHWVAELLVRMLSNTVFLP